ncbi:MAG: head-tail connector protein [Burkholderiaceae bacterium]|nr:head-tail connector protein [Burkholderiaceae bacterium]
MSLKLITVSGAEPVTLATAKLHCRADGDMTADDALITLYIKAARGQAEQELGRALVTAQYERALDAFPDGGIELAWPTVASIDAVQYVDTTGTLQSLAGSAYTLDNRQHRGWCLPAVGTTWPSTQDTANAVRVTFTAGWGEGAAVPEDVQAWILLRVATLYKHREMLASGLSIAELPRDHGAGLLDKWRVYC